MRFFGPMPPRGHRAVSEARAGSWLHVALIVKLPPRFEGLGRTADSVGDRRTNREPIAHMEAAAHFGHRYSSLAVNTQLKGIRFLIVFDGSGRAGTVTVCAAIPSRNRAGFGQRCRADSGAIRPALPGPLRPRGRGRQAGLRLPALAVPGAAASSPDGLPVSLPDAWRRGPAATYE